MGRKFPQAQQFIRGQIRENGHGDRRIMVQMTLHLFRRQRIFSADTAGDPVTLPENVCKGLAPVFLPHFGEVKMHIPGGTVGGKCLAICRKDLPADRRDPDPPYALFLGFIFIPAPIQNLSIPELQTDDRKDDE